MKTKTLLIAAAMFLALSAAAFAQATYTVGSVPVTAVINTGQTERTGDITFNQVGTSGTVANSTITITYPVPITNSTTVPGAPLYPAQGIGVVNCGGQYTCGAAGNVQILSVNNSVNGQGIVTILVTTGGLTTGFFTLTGVRVATAGSSLTSLSASLSGTQAAFTAGQTSVIVINSIAAGIASVNAPFTGAAAGSVNAVSAAVTQPVIKIKEGFLSAFGDPALVTNVSLRITLSAAPPAGVTITFPNTAATNGPGVFTAVASDGTALSPANSSVAITSTTTPLTVYYQLTTASDTTTQETLTIYPTITVAGSATLPLPSTDINFVVSLAPIGAALGTANAVISSPIPRFAALDVGPNDLLTIFSPQTTLLLPYASSAPAINYDTGIAISNTTTDPGSSALSGTPATKQSGKLTFYFYPQLPSPSGTLPTIAPYTTSGTTLGTGLDSTGALPSGSTYVVLLSQLLSSAGAPSNFAGYIIVVAPFSNAHGLFVVSNFTTFSQGALMDVLPADRTVTPEMAGQ